MSYTSKILRRMFVIEYKMRNFATCIEDFRLP